MPKFRCQIDLTEFYTYVFEVEANTQEEALAMAEKFQEDTPISELRNTYMGADVDYIITK